MMRKQIQGFGAVNEGMEFKKLKLVLNAEKTMRFALEARVEALEAALAALTNVVIELEADVDRLKE